MFHVKPELQDGPTSKLALPPESAQSVFGERLDLAVRYHASLATTGNQRGFIGPREVSRLWERHILNCAVLTEAIPADAQRLADVGSGAGLPGVPVAIARPDLSITLIEPLLKRSTYLHEVVEELGLSNVRVVRGRAEEKGVRAEVGRFDVVTSRAVAPLGKLARWCMPLVRPGGKMIALKGASVHEEWERDHSTITKAGGGLANIMTVGEGVLEQPTTVISIPRRR
ncbi:16S rRNA (guanine(527)-N(7))-methyltransferase RsmG [Corynebacterium ciconiae]|uniref:16S rRNA (guanine(527)-N(7))-methyltransferase RsmG n=1 Tax=Corynebacterium ciconiae TaxID=227319 RepID=UPI000378BD27